MPDSGFPRSGIFVGFWLSGVYSDMQKCVPDFRKLLLENFADLGALFFDVEAMVRCVAEAHTADGEVHRDGIGVRGVEMGIFDSVGCVVAE
jgi:hypothetical protein